jgi:acyl dehydratase
VTVRTFPSVAAFAELVGTELGSTDGPVITQDMIDRFGELTGSDDWIHSDPVRAGASEFGGTIAQGDLVVAIIPRLMDRIYKIENVALGLIYGSNRVRFISPIPVDRKLRVTASLIDARERRGGTQVTLEVVVHVEGQEKPVVSAEVVYWYLPSKTEAVPAGHPSSD